jgi:lipoprotein NlpI
MSMFFKARRWLLFFVVACFATCVSADEPEATEWLTQARKAALEKHHDDAILACDAALKLDPQLALAYQVRGEEQFKRGHIHDSVQDFEHYLELVPAARPGHWQLGISLYYDGQFAAGAKQFEAYQNVDDNDVENVVWRFLCQARVDGVEKARAALLKVKNDTRVPMKEVWEMFAGTKTPDDVLKRAEAGDPTAAELKVRRFNANLYVGLYEEALGNRDLAKKYLTAADEKYRIPEYMGDVAHVHAARLSKPAKPK